MTVKATSKSNGNRSPLNGDTPAANMVLGRYVTMMNEKSTWMQMFSPTLERQAVWTDLENELSVPVDSTSSYQVAEDTILLLEAMGCRAKTRPSPAMLRDWAPSDAGTALAKWKKKFRTAFGATDIGGRFQPMARKAPEAIDTSKIPLPQTPTKNRTAEPSGNVFSLPAKESSYYPDSHMVTPRSTPRTERLARETETYRPSVTTGWRTTLSRQRIRDGSDDSSDDDLIRDSDDDGDDVAEQWARQIRELSQDDGGSEARKTPPRLAITTHLPLGNIKPYYGRRNRSEQSIQWLRTFVYEMKGTHTPPNERCMAFELSLQEGSLHWYRQLPRKVRRKWTLLSDAFIKYYCSSFSQSAKARYYSAKRDDKEHVCDYLNRLNGYGRNAGVQFENGGRDAKDHVRHFLDTCGDRSLEERLRHVRVKDIHDLEDLINAILRSEQSRTSKETSFTRSRSRDDGRRRDDRRTEYSRDGYGRDRRDRDVSRRRDDRRDESRNRPPITLVEALTEALESFKVQDSYDSHAPNRYDNNSDEERALAYDRGDGDDGYESEGSDWSNDSATPEESHLAAANESERRAAADGTYVRTSQRPRREFEGRPQSGPSDRRFGRDNRDGRRGNQRSYGPCAACGGSNHSAHYCFRRCKLCKQVHDAGRCEAFQQLTTLLRTKVDKTELPAELQNIGFGSHLN